EGLDRGRTRGVAMFGAGGDRFEEVLASRPLPDRAALADAPYLLPLEALVERSESFCVVLVDRAKARLFTGALGRIDERTGVFDDVPGRHDQGGWSQANYQRHIEDHVGRHLRHVGDVVMRVFKRRPFDHLILGGPEEPVKEFERILHDYLQRRVVDRLTLPVTAGPADVLERTIEIEERLDTAREREVLDRLRAEAGAGRQGVVGLEPVLEALNEGRVDTLVVPFGVAAPGVRCTACGSLASGGERCPMCGGRMQAVPDVVESAA